MKREVREMKILRRFGLGAAMVLVLGSGISFAEPNILVDTGEVRVRVNSDVTDVSFFFFPHPTLTSEVFVVHGEGIQDHCLDIGGFSCD